MDDPGKAGRKTSRQDDASFEERLAAARARQGLDKPEAADRPASPWGLGLRAGLEVASALVVGVGLGLAVDWWAGTRPWFLVAGVFLGGAAGVLNVYRLMLGRRGS